MSSLQDATARDERISSMPTEGLSYDPNEPKFWDREAMAKELERAFDICHGCRLCFNLCPTFPMLFDAVDRHDGEVRALGAEETDAITESCFQCKVCYIKCPYTPDDQHEFALDFPKLLLRKKAIDVKERGLGMRERVLGNPDRMGRLASLTPKLANWASNTRFHRVVMEKMLGIHRDKLLPDFHGESFESWFRENREALGLEGENGKVALFFTCFVNYNSPGVGKAAVDVLSRNQCTVKCPKQNCCGMPALDGGDYDFARRQAQSNVESLLPLVRAGYKVLAVNPTCSLTLKKEYPQLVPTAESQEVASSVMDVNEYLFALKREDRFNRDFRSTPGSIAYHVPCHLRAQNIGYRSRDTMKTIPGARISLVAECCGHDGTYAMKTEFFELSLKSGKKAFEGMKEAEADIQATDCPLAAVQFEQVSGTRPVHPLEVLSRSYRSPDDGGFPTPVEPSPGE